MTRPSGTAQILTGSATGTIVDDDDVPSEIQFFATDEQLSEGNIISGDFNDTSNNDGNLETIREEESNGNPRNRVTSLEHTWLFENISSEVNSLFIDASTNATIDSFIFAYSTDGINYNNEIVTIGASGGSSVSGSFSVSGIDETDGTVYLRVIDTDRTGGERNRETISVDQIYFSTSPAAISSAIEDAIENDGVDILTGTNAQDTFVLGDSTSTYYGENGDQDYAVIDNFTQGEDIIQLYGSSDDYTVGSSVFNSDDLGIYFQDDLIGVVNDASNLSLNDSQSFAFV